ncbi:MAG: hypothetical protein NTZ39_02070, partial [Methanoregula sp.]|nr:hypothetical protein [Methanoregula sp.]
MKKKIVSVIITSSIIAGLIICFLLGTGCTSTPANLTAQDIAGKFVHQQDTLQDFSATVDIAMISYPNADRFQVQKKNPYSYRLEYLLSG